jgi:hypothetical protein
MILILVKIIITGFNTNLFTQNLILNKLHISYKFFKKQSPFAQNEHHAKL